MSPAENVSTAAVVRSLPFASWPVIDQRAWQAACQPGERLKRGGLASHLKAITRKDLVRRYGYFLDHVQRTDGLAEQSRPAAYVTPERVERYKAELLARVSSVTTYGSIYKLRRTSQLLAPDRDLGWLKELENDLALVMEPRSKLDRLVYTHVLADAAIRFMEEVHRSPQTDRLARARRFRNGLMVAVVAIHLIRLKNLVQLAIGTSFKEINRTWWICLSAEDTKEARPDERSIDPMLADWVTVYLRQYRPVLAAGHDPCHALWLSSYGGPLSYNAVEHVIDRMTLELVGLNVSPHMFRTSGASTCYVYAPANPHLATALLHHRDQRVTQQHYNAASSASATQGFLEFIKRLRQT